MGQAERGTCFVTRPETFLRPSSYVELCINPGAPCLAEVARHGKAQIPTDDPNPGTAAHTSASPTALNKKEKTVILSELSKFVARAVARNNEISRESNGLAFQPGAESLSPHVVRGDSAAPQLSTGRFCIRAWLQPCRNHAKSERALAPARKRIPRDRDNGESHGLQPVECPRPTTTASMPGSSPRTSVLPTLQTFRCGRS
jgi:hypothetical protein